LFLVYINDLLTQIEHTSKNWIDNSPEISQPIYSEFVGIGVRAYADDLLIKFFNLGHLRTLINVIEQWSKDNLIGINKGKGKSHIIQFNITTSQKLLPVIKDITST